MPLKYRIAYYEPQKIRRTHSSRKGELQLRLLNTDIQCQWVTYYSYWNVCCCETRSQCCSAFWLILYNTMYTCNKLFIQIQRFVLIFHPFCLLNAVHHGWSRIIYLVIIAFLPAAKDAYIQESFWSLVFTSSLFIWVC